MFGLNSSSFWSRRSSAAALAVALLVAAKCGATQYAFGQLWDSWEIVSTPANPTPTNTGFKIQVKNKYGTWRTVDRGTTDAAGNSWGWVCFSFGPTTEGKFLVGHDVAVRIVWANGTKQGVKVTNLPSRWQGAVVGYVAGVPSATPGQTYIMTQGDQDFIDDMGMTAWYEEGSVVSMKLPLHFEFVNMPIVQPIFPGDIILGSPVIEDDGRTLSVPVLVNQRIDPLNGIIIEDAMIAYDGIGAPAEYAAALIAQLAITPIDDPFNRLDGGEAYDFVRWATVMPEQPVEWFDETNGGAGFPDFLSLAAAHEEWLGRTDEVFDLEGIPVGEKLAFQYADRGVFVSGADGGDFNDLTGVAIEGDPNVVEDLTGYDGTYQPDGSQVYVRFQNTVENPDAPFTIEFAQLQREVAAFLACGVQGPDHSFTVAVYDHAGELIAEKQVEAELWEADPIGNNYETLFAVRSSIPNIRSISITNNSTVQFADALIIDSIQMTTWPSVNPADVNYDGDADLLDYQWYLECVTGPGGGVNVDCVGLDTDSDSDVDFGDFGAFSRQSTSGSLGM